MEKIIINIDSRFSDKELYKNAGKFTLKLDNTIKNVYDINITSFEFINLYYTFTSVKKNSSFKFNYQSLYYDIIIPDGFYNSSDLINLIQTLFDNLFPNVFIISLNSENGKIKIMSNQFFTLDFSNNSNIQSLGYLLGFRNNIYINPLYDDILSSYYYIGESLLNISGDNYLFLKINDYGNLYTNFYNDINNVLVLKKILAKLILSVNKTQIIFDNNNFITKKFIFRQPVNISKFDIELLDPNGNTINMNNIDYSFTLELNYLYNNDLNN